MNLIKEINAIRELPVQEDVIKYKMICELIDRTAEDVEPVRHGRWMEENPLDAPDCRLIRCSECGKSFIVPMNVPYEHWIDGRNYCYSCGARMDGDKDETAEADYEWSEEEQAYIEQGYMDTQVGLPDLYMN